MKTLFATLFVSLLAFGSTASASTFAEATVDKPTAATAKVGKPSYA